MLSDYHKDYILPRAKCTKNKIRCKDTTFFSNLQIKNDFFYVLNHFFYVFEQTFYYFFVPLLRKNTRITPNMYSLARFLHREDIVYIIYAKKTE